MKLKRQLLLSIAFCLAMLGANAQPAVVQGVKLPQLTTAQRDLIQKQGDPNNSYAEGQTIYNTDTNCMEFWNGTQWVSLCNDKDTKMLADLPAPDVSPMSGAFCGAVNFTIGNPGGWTSSEWESLTAANIEATCAGMPVTGAFSTDGTNYYYSVPATDAADQTVTLNFTGDVASKPILAMGSPAGVTVRTTSESSPSLSGQSCFDIAYVNEGASCGTLATRAASRANFGTSYAYELTGTLGAGVTLQSVVWSYVVNYGATTAGDAVSAFAQSAFSTSLTSNKVDVTFNPALLTNATLLADGITVTITATVTTSSGTCGTAVYTLTQVVNIRDCACCGCNGVALPVLIGANTYLTHEYMTEGVMRCWMVENLKEVPAGATANPSGSGSTTVAQYWTTYSGQSIGERGYYYNWPAAQIACPAGWSLPTEVQLIGASASDNKSIYYLFANNTATAGRSFWYNTTALAGDRAFPGAWVNWGSGGYWWSSTSGSYFCADSSGKVYRSTGYSAAYGVSVRCLKNQ